jgi:hypothetical protein
MALNTNALVTLDEAKSWLTTGGADDLKLEEEINRMSDFLEGYCRRPLKERTFTNQRRRGMSWPELRFRATPLNISQPLTVVVDDVAQTIWKSEADGDQGLKDVIIVDADPEDAVLGVRTSLWRSQGWAPFSSGRPLNILLTYTGGLASVPGDLAEAALYVLQKLWRDRQKQLADVTTVTLPSGSVTLLDIPMPRWARQALDERYRVTAVG